MNLSASTRSEYMSWFFQGGVKNSFSKAVYYLRGYDSGMSEDGFDVVTISDGDTFELKAGRTEGNGTTCYQDNSGTFLEFTEILT